MEMFLVIMQIILREKKVSLKRHLGFGPDFSSFKMKKFGQKVPLNVTHLRKSKKTTAQLT